ncbi:21804_t:CDS:2 [Cetraspora pellucida]|uniref:21804_t:CDS:1 n=1 Tax=Cetraspora pellucida TaxID=1433469 RepID=A0A9N8ZEB4_9GLOM|nr:21804_t:CDS:2 [Cetraspora pellucida]
MKDYLELSFCMPQALNEACAQKANPIIVNDHFNKLQKIIQEYSLTPDKIWNMVIAKKGAYQVYQVSNGSSHEHISVCPTISAAGTYIPPLIIYKGKRMIPGLLDSAPAGSVMGFTEMGYMRESLFRKYIEHFNTSIPLAHPVLLIMDGHKSHVNYTSVNFCSENNILLYTLPPYTTHILQPAELPFATLKGIYTKECDRFRINNDDKHVTKHTFTQVLGPSYIATYIPTTICNAFKITGIWPFNPSAISLDHLDPSLATEQTYISEILEQPTSSSSQSSLSSQPSSS